jgi:hypothetical protein
MKHRQNAKRDIVRMLQDQAPRRHDPVQGRDRERITRSPELPIGDLLPWSKACCRHHQEVVNLPPLTPESSRDIHDDGIVLTGGSSINLVRPALAQPLAAYRPCSGQRLLRGKWPAKGAPALIGA